MRDFDEHGNAQAVIARLERRRYGRISKREDSWRAGLVPPATTAAV